MEYNKNQFHKINDQKVLHKVGKQWVVLSLATLMSLGLGALATHTLAHADVNNDNQASNLNTLRGRLNQNLVQDHSQGQTSLNQVHNNSNHTYNGRQQNINQQADQLHQRILQNAVLGYPQNNQIQINASTKKSQSQVEDYQLNAPTSGLQGYITNNLNHFGQKHSSTPAQQAKITQQGTTGMAPQPQIGDSANGVMIPSFDGGHVVASDKFSDPSTARWSLDSNGVLLIHDGVIQPPVNGYWSFDGLMKRNLGSNFNSVKYIRFSNAASHNPLGGWESSADIFADFPNLIGIDFAGFRFADSPSVHIARFLSSDPNLRVINFNGLNTSNVTSDGSIFRSDYKLSDMIGFSNLNVDLLSDMNGTFASDKALKSLDLSGWNTGAAIGNNKGAGGTTNGLSQFISNCPGLRHIKLGPKTILTSQAINGSKNGSFAIAADGTPFELADGRPHGPAQGEPADGWTLLQGIESWGKWYNATYIETKSGDLYLLNGEIDPYGSRDTIAANNGYPALDWNNVKHVYTHNVSAGTLLNSTFQNLSSLETFDGSGMNVSNVSDMASTFQSDTNLDSLSGLSNWNVHKLQFMMNAFRNDKNLQSLSGLNNWDVSNVMDADYAFAFDDSLLNNIGISHWNIKNLEPTNAIFQYDNSLEMIEITSDFCFGGPASPQIPGHWVNLDGQSVDINDERTPGYYFNTANAVQGTINYKFGNQTVYTYHGYMLKTIDAGALPGSGASQMQGYELDPRVSQTFAAPSNGGTMNVQLDQKGKWGTATWDLTPTTVAPSDLATQKYGKGNLFVHDGTLDTNFSVSSMYNETHMTTYQANKVQNINTHNIQIPQNSSRLFDDEAHRYPNLTSIDVSGITNTSSVSNMYGMFCAITNLTSILGLNHFDTSNCTYFHWMFAEDTNLHNLDLSSFDTSLADNPLTENTTAADEANLFTGTPITQLKLGSRIKFVSPTSGVDKGRPIFNDSSYGYNISNPADIQNLEDGKPHPGTWIIPAAEKFHYHDIYSDIDGMGNPADHTVNISNPNYTLKQSDVPNGYALVNGDKSSPDYGKIVDPSTIHFNQAGDHDIAVAPVWHGLVYKWNQSTKHLEFTNGKISGWNGGQFLTTNGIIGGNAQYASDIKFDSGIDASNVTNMSGMFSTDPSLKSLDMSGIVNTNKINSLYDFANNSKNLQSVNLNGPGFNTSKVTNMSEMFGDDSDLQQINFGPNFKTSDVINFNYMFIADRNIKTLDLSGFDTRKAANSHFPGANSGSGLGSMLSNDDTGPKSGQNTVPAETIILGSNTVVDTNLVPFGNDGFINLKTGQIMGPGMPPGPIQEPGLVMPNTWITIGSVRVKASI